MPAETATVAAQSDALAPDNGEPPPPVVAVPATVADALGGSATSDADTDPLALVVVAGSASDGRASLAAAVSYGMRIDETFPKARHSDPALELLVAKVSWLGKPGADAFQFAATAREYASEPGSRRTAVWFARGPTAFAACTAPNISRSPCLPAGCRAHVHSDNTSACARSAPILKCLQSRFCDSALGSRTPLERRAQSRNRGAQQQLSSSLCGVEVYR
jgi:hypothetical protein